MRIAIIGCGKQGERHAVAFTRCVAAPRLVLCDMEPARGRALAARLRGEFEPSPIAVLADSTIDAVVIATPTTSHHGLAHEAIAAGKHVLCEKPFGASAAAARGLARDAKTAGLVGQVGYLYRFAPAIAAVRGCLPALGRIQGAEFTIAAPGGRMEWKHRRDSGGGVVNELLCHMLDLAFWIFGPPARCALIVKEVTRPRRVIAGKAVDVDAEDVVVAQFVLPTGAMVVLRGDFAAPAFAQTLEIRGENGIVRASIDPAFQSFRDLHRPAAGFAAGHRALPASEAGELYRWQAQGFLAAIARREGGPACGFAEAAAVCDVIEMFRAAPQALGDRPAA
jgi:myo-inositol 2-dehydrogenase / D-chiro-inositol 1-dehydrogenase